MTTDAAARDIFEPVLTLADLADYLDVPVQTLYDLRSPGRGPRGFRVGRRLHFRKSEVEAWLAGLENDDDSQMPAGSHR
jgi:excisionase family DNA binding protein